MQASVLQSKYSDKPLGHVEPGPTTIVEPGSTGPTTIIDQQTTTIIEPGPTTVIVPESRTVVEEGSTGPATIIEQRTTTIVEPGLTTIIVPEPTTIDDLKEKLRNMYSEMKKKDHEIRDLKKEVESLKLDLADYKRNCIETTCHCKRCQMPTVEPQAGEEDRDNVDNKDDI